MTDRSILFSGPMIAALREGRKTQTRRLIEPVPSASTREGDIIVSWPAEEPVRVGATFRPPVKGGDRLWVRETYYQRGHWEPVPGVKTKGGRMKWAFVPASDEITFEAPAEHRRGRHHKDPGTIAWHKRLGRFMPRRYSRMSLLVTEVRVERLQDCSEEDALAEGIKRFSMIDHIAVSSCTPGCEHHSHIAGYQCLWDSINDEPGKRWADNPWVVAISFEIERRDSEGEA